MSSTSTRFGMKLADGTDNFDNDLYIKQPLQQLDANAAKVAETLATASALRMEIVEVSFSSSGATNNITGTGTFAKAYTSNPVIIPANVTQTVSYADYIIKPHFPTVSTTNFTVKLQVAYDGVQMNNFGSGTLKMKFLVIGS